MKRGDIYTAATGSGYGSKPRPVLIVQADVFPTAKRLVVLIGSPVEAAAVVRVSVEPDSSNGLLSASEVMVDAIVPVRSNQFGRYCGRLADHDMRRVDRALMVFLGLGTAR